MVTAQKRRGEREGREDESLLDRPTGVSAFSEGSEHLRENASTGFSSEIGTKLRDWAVGQAGGSCHSRAALSSNDSKTRYRGGALSLTQGLVISFHVNFTGQWAILLLLSSQASNKQLVELLKRITSNLYVRPSAFAVLILLCNWYAGCAKFPHALAQFLLGPIHQNLLILWSISVCSMSRVLSLELRPYRVTMVVGHLGWVDLDLGCFTLLLGSR